MQMTNGHMKRCLITNHQRKANQSHNEISSHTCQKSYHQKSTNNTFVRLWRKVNPHTLLGMWIGATTMEKSVEGPQKTESIIRSGKWTPGFLLGKKVKTLILKVTRTLIFIPTLFTIAKTWKQPRCPSVDECIRKLWYI